MPCWTQVTTLMSEMAPRHFGTSCLFLMLSKCVDQRCSRSSVSYFPSEAVARGFANVAAVATWAGLVSDVIPAIEAETGNLQHQLRNLAMLPPVVIRCAIKISNDSFADGTKVAHPASQVPRRRTRPRHGLRSSPKPQETTRRSGTTTCATPL